MAVSGGQFIWSETGIRDGINQNVSSARRRWRMLRNVNLTEFRGALTKDNGCRKLSTSRMGTGSYDTLLGFDAHYSNGSQTLYLFQNAASDQRVYAFDGVSAYTDQGVSLAQVRPSVFSFNNKMCVLDGTTFRTCDASGTWATPGNTLINDCLIGTVYANRAIVAGSAAQPYTFSPSNVRDVTTFDTSEEVDVTTAGGEKIVGVGKCGSHLIVMGSSYTRSYSLDAGHPKDWEWWGLSDLLGITSPHSFTEVPRAKGNAGVNLAFFWTSEGPVMVAQIGTSIPTLHPLWYPLLQAVQGTEFEGVPALSMADYGGVTSAWVPHKNEVIFSVKKKTTAAVANSRNDMLLCLDLDSALRVATNPDEEPTWRIRDNTSSRLPVSTIFPVKLNPATGLPSTSGQRRLMSAQNGYVYEHFAQEVYKDDGIAFGFEARRTGYNGEEDGVRPFIKSPRYIKARVSQVADGEIYAQLIVNGAGYSSTTTLSLDQFLVIWSTNTDDGTWGDGSVWNGAEAVPVRGEFGLTGDDFDLRVYDEGTIDDATLVIYSWDILGGLEDRINA
jgi:hypothetical protein